MNKHECTNQGNTTKGKTKNILQVDYSKNKEGSHRRIRTLIQHYHIVITLKMKALQV